MLVLKYGDDAKMLETGAAAEVVLGMCNTVADFVKYDLRTIATKLSDSYAILPKL